MITAMMKKKICNPNDNPFFQKHILYFDQKYRAISQKMFKDILLRLCDLKIWIIILCLIVFLWYDFILYTI